MSNIELSAEFIKKFTMENGVDFVGIASSDRFENAPIGHRPVDLLHSTKSIIVCGKEVASGALYSPGTLYHKTVEMVNMQLDKAALKVTHEIEKNGGIAVAISTDAPYYYWDEEKQYGRADLSIKHAAQAAGLGKIGKSGMFISKDYGVYTRMVCVLTDVELEADTLTDWEPCPQNCTLCIDACPTKAIKPECDFEQSLCRQNMFKKN
ncbi:MAG: Epoxyqueuosine reductase [Firmicutes bacterium ADurb.Bin419]|jgi:epoxyqueuosine reductase QueG|nr:MAG: Epoxyqueuosine reductase [Firmicutes bacterium ADurb.Bin419]